jgi:hypothetical protein
MPESHTHRVTYSRTDDAPGARPSTAARGCTEDGATQLAEALQRLAHIADATVHDR